MEVLRFFAALYCITSEATFDALRGGAIEQGTDTKDENGHYDLCLTNLPNVPTARTLRRYTNTQFLIRDALGVSDPMVSLALKMLGGGDSSGVWVGATFDCVYGKPKAEVVRDLDGKYFVAGGGSSEALVDAALAEDDPLLKEGSFKEKKIATRLMTIVLHSFHSGLSVLVAIIPINEETGEIISACYLALRRLIFKHNSWLIWAGGDGAEQNQKAWKIVELKSKGDATTLLADVKKVEDLPFFWSGDTKEHDLKGIKRDLFGHQIWVDGEVLRFDHELADLRGFLEAPGSDEFRLTAEGDYSKSRVGGKKLVDVIGDPAETEEYHRIFDADEDNGDGEIVDFEWSPSVREPQWAAVVEFEKGGREAYFFRELPSLVIAAESKQPDDVILEYEDLPDDDELPGDGERDLMAALDAVRAEED